MLGADDEVAGDDQLEPAAQRQAVHGGDHRLVEAPQLGQAGKPARSVVGGFPPLADLLVLVSGLEVPTGREDPVAGGGHNADPEVRIALQFLERGAEGAAGRQVDRVNLWPIERYLHDMTAFYHPDRIAHGSYSLLCIAAPALPGRDGVC